MRYYTDLAEADREAERSNGVRASDAVEYFAKLVTLPKSRRRAAMSGEHSTAQSAKSLADPYAGSVGGRNSQSEKNDMGTGGTCLCGEDALSAPQFDPSLVIQTCMVVCGFSVGPCSESIGDLEQHRYERLCLMTAQQLPPYSICGDIPIRNLALNLSLDDTDAVEVIRQHSAWIDLDSPATHEAVAMHVEALHTWSTIANELPSASPDSGPPRQLWRLVDRLLLAAFWDRPHDPGIEAGWMELTKTPTAAAAQRNRAVPKVGG